ncbi:hypothetical protein FNV43_RR00724 [Rhamnella rubrinervis]|uniref:Uncharacterized protein n=1 Tax=Rhamnella rubrinervis TaxID=2594499 RepID=A0A8K0MRF0_9ROSA|nr:hypothetical protein FNV43_RR00724 [Rhamnella rubrinervis]
MARHNKAAKYNYVNMKVRKNRGNDNGGGGGGGSHPTGNGGNSGCDSFVKLMIFLLAVSLLIRFFVYLAYMAGSGFIAEFHVI